MTGLGQVIMGIGVGGLIFVIRTYGHYPEGVTSVSYTHLDVYKRQKSDIDWQYGECCYGRLNL